jgi:Leucine-rich repeat (LRR) protein
MQYSLSIISLLFIAIFTMWWSTRGITPTSPSPTNTNNSIQEQVREQIDSTAQKARTEVKNAIEATSNTTSSNVLDMSEKGLTKVPMDIFDRTELESLNLSNNLFSGALPAEVRHLQNLKTLDLSGNKFTGVPAEIGQLKNLEVLNLANNFLTGLPNELGNLSSLKILKLSGNHYSEQDLTSIKKNLPTTTQIITQ